MSTRALNTQEAKTLKALKNFRAPRRKDVGAVSINMAVFAQYYNGSIKDTHEALKADGFDISEPTLRRYAARPQFLEFMKDENKAKEGLMSAEKCKRFMAELAVRSEDETIQIRALENIARMHGLFIDKLQLDDKTSLTAMLDSMLEKEEAAEGMNNEVSLADVPDDSEALKAEQTAPEKPKRKKKTTS